MNEETIISLKVELEESKRIKEFLLEKWNEKEKIHGRLEEKVLLFKEELEKIKYNIKIHKCF